MSNGPKGEKRPAELLGAAVIIANTATGEIEEPSDDGKNQASQALRRMGGKGRPENDA